jgi:hypothetical protein
MRTDEVVNTKPSTVKNNATNSLRNLIYLNIGGKQYTTLEYTLTKHESIFRQIVEMKDKSSLFDKHGNIYFDRPYKYFDLILNTLRRNETLIDLPIDVEESFVRRLEEEIDFYGYSSVLYCQIGPVIVPPTWRERMMELVTKVWSQMWPQYIEEDFVHGFGFGLIFSCIFVTCILKSIVHIFQLDTLYPLIFWPLYGCFAIGFLWILAIVFIEWNRGRNAPPFLVLLLFVAILSLICFYFSFIFDKFYFAHLGIPYRSWVGVMWVFEILLVGGSVFLIAYTAGHYLQQGFRQFVSDVDDIYLVMLWLWTPMWSFTLVGLIFYADSRIEWRLGWIYFPMMLHLIVWCGLGFNYASNQYQIYQTEEQFIFHHTSQCGVAIIWMMFAFMFNFGPILKFVPLDVVVTIFFFQAFNKLGT